MWTLTASTTNYTRKHKKGSVELPTESFGFFCSLLLRTNVVLGFQNPVTLVLISKNFDLIQWSNVLNLSNIHNLNQTPVSKKLGNTIATLDIIRSKVCVLTIKGKQFLKVNQIVPSPYRFLNNLKIMRTLYVNPNNTRSC